MTVSTSNLSDLAKLDGLITPDVGEYLYEAAKLIPEGQLIVEIGAWKGKSTCYLAAGRRDGHGGNVVSVDQWDTTANQWSRYHAAAKLTEWSSQVAKMGFTDTTEPLVGKSTDVASQWGSSGMLVIGLLYIDGDHERQAVIDDFNSWRPYLSDRATVIFDDYGVSHNPDVAPVVHELHRDGLITEPRIESNGRIAVAEVL